MSLLNSPEQAGKPLEGTMAQGMNAVKLPEREKGGVSVSRAGQLRQGQAPGLEL
jgi:hypothetical protein